MASHDSTHVAGPSFPLADRICVHWPLGCAPRIRAAARSLLLLSGQWARARQANSNWSGPEVRCIDPTVWHDATQDVEDASAAAAAQEIASVFSSMSGLADDFAMSSQWLATSIMLTWDGTQIERMASPFPVLLGEGHRLLAKESLACDANAMLAWLLRRALRGFDSDQWTMAAISADLRADCALETQLQDAAEALDRVGVFADEASSFVEELDLRVQAFRQRASHVVAQAQGRGQE